MARSSAPRPPVPTLPERARTLTVRARTAALVVGPPADAPDPGGYDAAPVDGTEHGTEHGPDSGSGRVTPTLHHVPASGAATLQLPADHLTVARVRAAVHLPVMLELTDSAPLEMRQPVRGLVWISGRLRLLPPRVARRAALRIAAELPDERLLDVGHGDVLLRLDPTLVVLSDAEGRGALAPAEVAAAGPDQVAAVGDPWLSHLARSHGEIVRGLARHLPLRLRAPGHRIVPLSVDRLGLRLRVEGRDGDHDVRLGFSRPVTCPRMLGDEVRRLAGMPCAAEPGLTPTAAELPAGDA